MALNSSVSVDTKIKAHVGEAIAAELRRETLEGARLVAYKLSRVTMFGMA